MENKTKLITVRNYSTKLGKTTQWGYTQIKQNKVQHQEIDGKFFIVVPLEF